jgi:hypothetical protein
VDAYPLAFVYDALGRQNEALAELERAAAENSPYLFMMDIDPRLDGLRSNPRFTRLRNRFFRPHTVRKAPSEMKPRGALIPAYSAKDAAERHQAVS